MIFILSVGFVVWMMVLRCGVCVDDVIWGFELSEMWEKFVVLVVFCVVFLGFRVWVCLCGGDVRLTRVTNRFVRNVRFEGVCIIMLCVCKMCVSLWM